MKKIKKLASLLLAAIMVLSMTVTAFAADEDTPTYSITIKNTATNHIYEAYQIFKGDLSEDGVLSNIQWGESVTNASGLGDAAAIAEKLDTNYNGEDPLDVDDLLEKVTLGDPVANSNGTSNPYVISGLKAGYYLVKDRDNSLANKDDSYTEYIVKVVKNVETEPKSDVPEVEKKVKDTNDSTGETSGWQDSADHDINDAVSFQLTATLANNVSAYDTYKIVFHDTLSAGLEYVGITSVTIGGKTITSGYEVTSVKNEDGTTTLTITFEDVKTLGATNSSEVVVEYTATLDSDAVIGSLGNPNTVYLEYSNNPNWKPENPDDTPETGKTPEDKVIVFTYKVVVNKVDENEKPLEGAGFTLQKKNAEGKYVAVGEELKGEALTTFEWKGLDDGEYKLVETTTPTGYNTIADIEFTITADHDEESDDPKLTYLEGGELFKGEVSTGTLTANVENKAGATLPETGGTGTTIFYVVGAILVIGAGVVMITRKRMSGNN